MFNFTTRTSRLFYYYALDVKEVEKLDKFLQFLEKSGVSEILNSVKVNDQSKGNNQSAGGRATYNPCHLFATIIYGFAFGKGTLREIEASCKFDLRYMYLMDYQQPAFKTFGNFINAYILPNYEKLFYKLMTHMFHVMQVTMEDVFIDGTKIEADANKYKFVWKPTTYHLRLSDKIRDLLKEVGLDRGLPEKGIIEVKMVASKLTEFHRMVESCPEPDLKKRRKQYAEFQKYLEKSIEYTEKENICGPDRNSYYKTDHDATAMTLKTDYYSGLGSNMHAAYNIQIVVANGMVAAYYVSQARTDITELIPALDKIHEYYGFYPTRVCADAGYGSLINYKFLKQNNIENYVKHQSWEGNVTGKRPIRYILQDDGSIICLSGKIGSQVQLKDRHAKKAGNVFYRVEGCSDCAFSDYCKQWQNIKDEDFKIFEINPEMVRYRQQAEENLLSVKGIEMRVNRSIQAEGAFGVVKQDMGYTRFRRTSIDRVRMEFALTILGYNIRKLFKFFNGKWKSSNWKAPDDIEPEKFKKPSAKRLSNKVKKKKQKSKNQEAKKSYKYKKGL